MSTGNMSTWFHVHIIHFNLGYNWLRNFGCIEMYHYTFRLIKTLPYFLQCLKLNGCTSALYRVRLLYMTALYLISVHQN